MIFFARTVWRTTFVRTTALLLGVLGVCAVLLFVFDASDPRERCAACAPGAYQGTIPDHWVALTFDDGPTADATPEILAVLKKHNVHASFFVLGRYALENPDLLRQMVADGHDVGNHTFTHEEHLQVSEERMLWDLNMANKIIEAVTGRSALMYRPPYLDDMDPYTVFPSPDENPAWSWAQRHGYITVGTDLDTYDWRANTPHDVFFSVQQLVAEKETNKEAHGRRVFMFHDIPETAQSLDDTIVFLQSRGYRIVPLSTMMGVTQSDIMPEAGFSFTALWYGILLESTSAIQLFFYCALFIITLFTAVRFGVIVAVTLWLRHRRNTPARVPVPALKVSVLVPAYNEAENISATLQSIMENHHCPDEVIVINDGSTDRTAAIVQGVIGTYGDVIRLINTTNGGKARALNTGLTYATGDVVVVIDGDTVLDEYCVGAVVQAFADPLVGAAAGRILPANPQTLLEKYQTLEYLIGQAMD